MQLDTIDRKLLNFLQEDCKRTNKELSLLLDLSVTAVYERIKKLERASIISAYKAQLNKHAVHRAFVVFCHIKLIQHSKDYLTKFEKEVVKLSEVLECYHVSGDYDYILKVLVKDMDAYREFMVNKITVLQHIGSTHSTFMINEVKHSTAIKL
ncbi:Lrp/AsnC family transcriptional regulator [Sungkyunkwania multivorans]|uniref:Lrp/AsnC family transcriptional regulator n=1 Tax=Sungkyunkwania multivorans TaxID=1173618 RepID=A0ABW3CWD0_9FLAO